MKKLVTLFVFLVFFFHQIRAQNVGLPDSSIYLSEVKKNLVTKFPKNRVINIIFHGHSVPSGYWSKQEVHGNESYPNLLLMKIRKAYPYAVVNVILTAMGGENAVKGEKRFLTDALVHHPDVIVIDYALNDIGLPLNQTKMAWQKMIEECLKRNIKVILVTPSPDQRISILKPGNKLLLNAEQIRDLAVKYQVGLADPFASFQAIMKKENTIVPYMSHVNHPNEKGHEVIANLLFNWFKPD